MALELMSHEIQHHDEVDVYGTPHLFVFVEGDLNDLRTYRQAIVEVTVDDKPHGADREGTVTTGWARQIFPYTLPHNEDLTTSLLETAGVPTEERIISFAHELAQFACGDIKPPKFSD